MSELPNGWTEATIEELRAAGPHAIVDGPYGSSLKTSHYCSDGVRVIRLGNIGSREFLNDDVAFISEGHFNTLAKHGVAQGDILVAALGDPVGRACLVPPGLGQALVKADCFRLRLYPQLSPTLFMLWFNTEYARAALSTSAHGLGRTRINLSALRRTKVPVPPLSEQRRIVAKIDTLSAKSKRARGHLDHISRLVEKYKQAILESAFRGDATRECRSYADRGWKETSPRELFEWSSGKNLPSKRQADGNIPVIGGNGVSGYHDTALIDFPTLVIGRVGAQCGNVHRSDGPAWVTDNAIYARSISGKVDLDFAVLFFRISNLNSLAGGSGQPYVNQTTLNGLVIPVPAIEEQREIVRRVNAAFVCIDRLASEANSARKLINHLDQAVLSRAFQGELVPQDPNDEPARAILERVRAEQAAAPVKGRRGSRRRA